MVCERFRRRSGHDGLLTARASRPPDEPIGIAHDLRGLGLVARRGSDCGHSLGDLFRNLNPQGMRA